MRSIAAVGHGKAADQLAPGEAALQSRYADLAVETLGQACTLGYKNLANLKTDPDLDPIREYPGYKQLVENLERR